MTVTYFADLETGETVIFRDKKEARYNNRGMAIASRIIPARVSEREPGKLFGYDEVRGWLPITRRVHITGHNVHECDARCRNATGRVMKCECACGGKNHGKSS